jgi:hypothetical protein
VKLFVNTRSGVPIYKQLAQQIEKGVIGEILKPGDQLPTVREVALELIPTRWPGPTVSLNTAASLKASRAGAPLSPAVSGRPWPQRKSCSLSSSWTNCCRKPAS